MLLPLCPAFRLGLAIKKSAVVQSVGIEDIIADRLQANIQVVERHAHRDRIDVGVDHLGVLPALPRLQAGVCDEKEHEGETEVRQAHLVDAIRRANLTLPDITSPYHTLPCLTLPDLTLGR